MRNCRIEAKPNTEDEEERFTTKNTKDHKGNLKAFVCLSVLCGDIFSGTFAGGAPMGTGAPGGRVFGNRDHRAASDVVAEHGLQILIFTFHGAEVHGQRMVGDVAAPFGLERDFAAGGNGADVFAGEAEDPLFFAFFEAVAGITFVAKHTGSPVLAVGFVKPACGRSDKEGAG